MYDSKLVEHQTKAIIKRFTKNGKKYELQVKIKWDDECGNGHNSFSITGNLYDCKNNRKNEIRGGCIHDDIVKHCPELKKYIKWHLASSEEPSLYYLTNTIYHASDKDCWGFKKGQPSAWSQFIKFKDFPITFEKSKEFLESLKMQETYNIVEVKGEKSSSGYQYPSKYTFDCYANILWHECPFDNIREAEEFKTALETKEWEIIEQPIAWSQGKERDLNAARRCALWPDATDEELMLPEDELRAKLLERMPTLMQELKHDVEELGFVW